MDFLKSLFGASKPTVSSQMSGQQYLIHGLYAYSSFTSEKLFPPDQSSPWTKEKAYKYVMQFTSQPFIFDGEIGCMLVHYFQVDRNLQGILWAFLYKETVQEFLDYRKSWGERPEPVGMLKLTIWQDGIPQVNVYKSNAPDGQPCQWTNYRREPLDVDKQHYSLSIDGQRNASEFFNDINF